MASEAKKAFDLNIERAAHFLDIHENAHTGPGAPTLPLRELPRAAVVFAIGALDAYLSELTAEVMVERLGRGASLSESREAMQKIGKEMPGLAIEVALMPKQTQRLDHIREVMAEYYNSVTNHGPKSVGALCRAFGLSTDAIWNAASVTALGAAEELQRWTDVRHDIVHRGKKSRVRRNTGAKPCVKLISAIVDAIEAEIARVSP